MNRIKRVTMVAALLLQGAAMQVSGEGIISSIISKLKGFLYPSKPVPSESATDSTASPDVIYRFFDEDYTPGGYQYHYPEGSKVAIDEDVAKNGEVSLRFDLVPDEYSGGAACLYNMVYDLRPLLKKAALQFWIRGALGNESTMVALVDEDKSDGRKTVVRVRVNWFVREFREWTKVSIPLETIVRLNERGVYYDESQNEEFPADFDWDKVAEFRIESRKNENKTFRVWVDDVCIVRLNR